jgi:hypothetical protein
MEINYMNPENMAKPWGHLHAISLRGNHKTLFVEQGI